MKLSTALSAAAVPGLHQLTSPTLLSTWSEARTAAQSVGAAHSSRSEFDVWLVAGGAGRIAAFQP